MRLMSFPSTDVADVADVADVVDGVSFSWPFISIH